MKRLSNYISEAVSRGNRIRGGFPKHPNRIEIFDFLEANDFEYASPSQFVELVNYCNTWKKDFFSHGPFNASLDTHWIEFYRHGDDAKFFLLVDVPDDYRDRSDITNFRMWTVRNGRIKSLEDYDTYEEFRKAINQHYGW